MPAGKTKTKESTKTSGRKTIRKSVTPRKKPDISQTAVCVEEQATTSTEPIYTPFDPPTFSENDFGSTTTAPDETAVEEIASSIAELEQLSYSRNIDLLDIEHVEGQNEVSRKIVARIASLAANEVQGYLPARQDFRTRVEDLLRGRIDGIKVDIGTSEAAIDILARVQYGTDISLFANRLREVVAKRILEMTGLKVVEVNVTIQDIAQ